MSPNAAIILPGFNEAAGFTRRKRHSLEPRERDRPVLASMRPPDLPAETLRAEIERIEIDKLQ